MKIFVAGATGVLGRRVVKLLVDAGHEATGIARSGEKASMLASLGGRRHVSTSSTRARSWKRCKVTTS